MMCMLLAGAYVLNADDGTCLAPKITLHLFPWLKANKQKGKLMENWCLKDPYTVISLVEEPSKILKSGAVVKSS